MTDMDKLKAVKKAVKTWERKTAGDAFVSQGTTLLEKGIRVTGMYAEEKAATYRPVSVVISLDVIPAQEGPATSAVTFAILQAAVRKASND